MTDFEKFKQEFTDLIFLDLEGRNKEEVLSNIASFASKERIIEHAEPAYTKFLEYEKARGTTAVGNGLACPEASEICMSRSYAFILCRTKDPIEFGSPDGNPVRIILATLYRNRKDPEALRAAARLSRLLRKEEFRARFLMAKDIDEASLLFLLR